jgi:hypothetical protein
MKLSYSQKRVTIEAEFVQQHSKTLYHLNQLVPTVNGLIRRSKVVQYFFTLTTRLRSNASSQLTLEK